MSEQQFRFVHNHSAFVPSPLPPAPYLANSKGHPLPVLGDLLFMPFEMRARLQIGFVNLLCATMLPDTGDLDLVACLKTLDDWAQIVKRETDRKMWKFHRDPGDFENSEAYFRALVLITVLQRDLGVHYDPESRSRKEFKSSGEGFIHGLLTGNRAGTCANMPVLVADIGRKLGYPIYLVGAKGHTFCRWNSTTTGERFNIEASGRGFSSSSDEHYMHFPKLITEEEANHGIYLRGLDPMEEFAHFMATRGHCLIDKGYILDAIVAFSHAHRLAPADPVMMSFLLDAVNRECKMRDDGTLPCSYRQAEIFKGNAPIARFTLNDRFGDRVMGANTDETKPGRLAPND